MLQNGAKIIDRFGDRDPITYSGGILFQLPDGSYEMEYTHGFEAEEISEEQQKKGAKVTVYQFLVEPKNGVFDVEDFDWVDWDGIRSNWPSNFKSLDYHLKSTNITDIAFIYHEIGQYEGFHELDDYPEKFTDAELQKRWDL